MRPYLLTVTLGLILVGGLNYAVDPTGIRPAPPFRIPSPWPANQVWSSPDNFDERSFRTTQIEAGPKPDIVVLGSSRALLVDSAMFAPRLKIYNAAMAGASVEDYAAIWQILQEQHKIPQWLIVFADPWILNANSGQIRWRTNSNLYQKFILQASLANPSRWALALRALILRWRCFYDNLCGFLSWPAFSSTVKEVSAGKFLRTTPEISLSSAAAPERPAWKADGSFIYPAKALAPKTPAQLRALGLEYAGEREVYSLGKFHLDAFALSTLQTILEMAHRAGTEVLLVTPPYQRVVLDALGRRPEYKDVIDQFSSTLRELSGRNDSLTLCEAIAPEAADCRETEFIDGMHARRTCVEKVVRLCLAGSPTWKNLLR